MCVFVCVCLHNECVYLYYAHTIIQDLTLTYYYSGEPSKVDLPGPASQIACGDNHTVVLLVSGEIHTFGKHKVRNSSPITCIVHIPPLYKFIH